MIYDLFMREREGEEREMVGKGKREGK